jgi:hypothetical protein
MTRIYHIHLHSAAELGEIRALSAVATALEQQAKNQDTLIDALMWGVSLAALGATFGLLATTPLIIPTVATFGITFLLGLAHETYSN